MNNNNLLILGLLGVGGYFAYTMYQKSQAMNYGGGTGAGSGSGGSTGGSTGGKTIDVQGGIDLLTKIINQGRLLYMSLTQKKQALNDIQTLINSGKSQSYIEIYMANKYNMTPTDVNALVNQLYK